MEPTNNFPDFGLPEGDPDVAGTAVPDKGSDVSHETKARIRQSINRQQLVSSTAVEAEIKALQSFGLQHPQETKILAMVSPRSRSGKTSLVVNLGATFARGGLKVLIIDLAQRSTEFLVSADSSMSEVFYGKKTIADVAQQVPGCDNLWCVAADASLDVAELEMSYSVSKETIVQRALNTFLDDQPDWDYILIDTPSSFGLLTINAVLTAQGVMIPSSVSPRSSAYSQSLEQLLNFVEKNFGHVISYRSVVNFVSEMSVDDPQSADRFASEERQAAVGEIAWSREAQEADIYSQIAVDDYPVSPIALDYLKCAREINKTFI